MASTRVLALAFVCFAAAVQVARAQNWPPIVLASNATNATRTGTGGAGNSGSAGQQKRQESLRETLRTQDADGDTKRLRTRTAQERAELREQLRRHKSDLAQ
jgi:hypothetical protein